MKRKAFKIALYNLAFLLILISGCGGLEIKSLWKDHDIKIDGKDDDWKNGTYIKDANCSFYACNDQNALYICIVSTDRALARRAMIQGLTVWVESDKEDNKFGIHYPLGRIGGDKPSSDQTQEFSQSRASGNHSDEEMDNRKTGNPFDEEKMFANANEYEILNKSSNVEGRYSLTEDNGIKVKAGSFQGRFVYELKIPIVPKYGSLNSIAADTTSNIKLSFESGQFDMSKIRRARGGGKERANPENGSEEGASENMPSMGRRGNGMGGHGNRGQGQFGEGQSSNQFKLDVHITLSSRSAK
ncbi:MAG: hypothetical protein Q8933_16940 [Bacteroidota bacterium]|nr:hypothetical protein [Bacteroidota bacterium]